jgi:hypothetical protein
MTDVKDLDEADMLLRAIAADRAKLHADHASSRPLSEDYENCGLAGEIAFAREFHQPVDLTRRPGGDGGTDFVLPLRVKVDVKAFRKPNHLIVEVGKVIPQHIYVLCAFDGDILGARLIGWEWGSTLARAPTRDFGYGIINHFIAAEKLRLMQELHERVMVLQ